MTGLDTNVLVRYIVRDDRAQASRADAAIKTFTPADPGFISLVTLAELNWVLRASYRMPKADLVDCLERLLNARDLVVENAAAAELALKKFASTPCDFADCLIAFCGELAGCRETVTFDVAAARATGMRLLQR
jgi:predicted nucleic-acid-binding protein